MDEHSTAEPVARYLEYARTGSEELFPAWNAVTSIVRTSADGGWAIVQELMARVVDPHLLAYVAAGPLEDLLAWHGPEVVDRLLALAAHDDTMRLALARGVWGRNRIRPDVQKKIDALVNLRPS